MTSRSSLYTDETEPFPVAAAPPAGSDGTPVDPDRWRSLALAALALGVCLAVSLWYAFAYHLLPADQDTFMVVIRQISDTSRVLRLVANGGLLVAAIVCAVASVSPAARLLSSLSALLGGATIGSLIWSWMLVRGLTSGASDTSDIDLDLLGTLDIVGAIGEIAAITLFVAGAAGVAGYGRSRLRVVLATLAVLLGQAAPIVASFLDLRGWDDFEDPTRRALDIAVTLVPCAVLVLAIFTLHDAGWGGRRRAWPRRHSALGWVLGAVALTLVLTLATIVAGFLADRHPTALFPVLTNAQIGALVISPFYLVGLAGLLRGPRGTPVPVLAACSALFTLGGWITAIVLTRWSLQALSGGYVGAEMQDRIRTLSIVSPTLGYVGTLLFVGALAQLARRVGAFQGDAAASRTLILMLAAGAFVPLALWGVFRAQAAPLALMFGLAMLVLGVVVVVNFTSALVQTRARILETERGFGEAEDAFS